MPEVALPPQLEEFPVEYNLPWKLTSTEIHSIRGNTKKEVYRVMPGSYVDPAERGRLAFGEKIVETEKENESPRERQRAIQKQLSVSLRFLDEALLLDRQICGDDKEEISGVRLPVLRAKQRGKQCIVSTRNSWGSTDYHDPIEQEKLRQDLKKGPDFSEEGFQHTLEELQKERDTSKDIPVVNEEDQLDIFDLEGHLIGRAVVKEVDGNTLRLHVHSKLRIKQGCTMRKRSNRKALLTYRHEVREYCDALGCARQMKNREGKTYQWEDRNEEKRASKARSRRYEYDDDDMERPLTQAERAFLGIEREESMEPRYIAENEIPRAILDDPEQSVAFAMGAMGAPCYLVQGPPGTGKTTVASHLLKHFQKTGIKTLVLSHSNKGLDVLLSTARGKGVKLHRGGTEQGMCDKKLHDAFIRRDMHYPKRSDFLKVSFDANGFSKAQELHTSDPTNHPAPQREKFTQHVLDEAGWKEAWRVFEEQKKQVIRQLQFEDGLVAGVTLNTLITDEIINALDFDVVIVDEASKGYIFEMIPALKKAKKQIIFIGDHKQLGNIDLPRHLRSFLEDQDRPTENGDNARPKEIGADDVDAFDQGPFAFMADNTGIPRVMLKTNRRSLPDIVALVSHAQYGGKLKAGRIDHENTQNPGTIRWVDTAKRLDKTEVASGVSKTNPAEAGLVARKILKEHERGHLTSDNFAVISMYRAQGKVIRERVRRLLEGDASRQGTQQTISRNIFTVDASQGSEWDNVHLATTRSNQNGSVGFLENVNRVNVACSRARKNLTIYGDSETLVRHNSDPASREYFRIAHRIAELRGAVHDQFSAVASHAMPEELKRQTHAARRNRQRRASKRRRAQAQEPAPSAS